MKNQRFFNREICTGGAWRMTVVLLAVAANVCVWESVGIKCRDAENLIQMPEE